MRAEANLLAHGVSFAEAVTVSEDALALTREDAGVVEEQPFVTLDVSDRANLLVGVDAYQEPDVIQVISAWKAHRRQREL